MLFSHQNRRWVGSGRQESQTWKQAFPELIAIEHGFHPDEDGVTS